MELYPSRWLSAGAALALAAGVMGCNARASVEQPVAFSHAIHVGENEMECTDCHPLVTEHAAAGRPGLEVCADCHDTTLGDSPEEEKVVAYVEEGTEIPWRRIFWIHSFVHFSHARHVTAGKLECETCHGDMANQEVPPPEPLRELRMPQCIECHRSRGVRTDCNACHR